MNNTIEERFNPPFAVYENLVGNYIVRPIDWEGIWNPDGKLVGGNSIVGCPIKEDAEMIADTFNRFFKLQESVKKSLEINEKLIQEYKIQYGNQESKLLLALETQNEILRRVK